MSLHLFWHVSITSALYKGINNTRTEEDHSGKQFYLLTRLILTREHSDSPIMEQYFIGSFEFMSYTHCMLYGNLFSFLMWD